MTLFWTLHDTIGRLQTPRLAGEVDVAYPWRGFAPALTKRADIGWLKVFTRAHAWDAPETLVEYYQRGVDLVATYAQTPERTVRPQAYWRYVAPEQGANDAGLELILSAQTSLLESAPTMTVASALGPGEALFFSAEGEALAGIDSDAWRADEAAPRALLFRPRDAGYSYLEMVHPADFAGVRCASDAAGATIYWRLFPESLEKGVIRRGRVRGMLLPRAADEAQVVPQLARFLAAPLALST